MADEERRRNTELLNSIELILARRLAVFDAVTSVLPRKFLLHESESRQDIVNRGVTVGVNRHLIAGAMVGSDQVDQLFPAARRIADVGGLPFRLRCIGRGKKTRETLQGAVMPKLDARGTDKFR